MDKEELEREITRFQQHLEARKNRLLEIYKTHVQLVSDTSNRRAATNRFYPAIMSGLLIIYFTFLQRKDEIFPDRSIDELVVGISTIVVGYLGFLFSGIWFFTINTYLRLISRKYEVLKKLEDEFEFQFFREEWELLDKKKKKVSYEKLSRFELYIPFAFLLIFLLISYAAFFLIIPASEALKMIQYGHLYPFINIVKSLF